MKWFLFCLLMVGCSPEYPEYFGKTTLPGIVEVGKDYEYTIQLPPKAAAVGYHWQYDGKIIFRSMTIRPKTELLSTEMFFFRPGYFTLVLYVEDPRGQIHTFKSIYLAEHPTSTYGRRLTRY
jgi:hypothetical protein